MKATSGAIGNTFKLTLMLWAIAPALAAGQTASGQVTTPPPGTPPQTVDVRIATSQRALVTRAELLATLRELEAQGASTAYSPAVRFANQQQINIIKYRLENGDMRTGDIIHLTVEPNAGFTNDYKVTERGTIKLRDNAELSVKGALRSELAERLTEQFKDLVRQPSVQAVPQIQIQIFGAVGHPCFCSVDATMLLSEVITKDAGGPQNSAKLDKSTIKRGDTVIVAGKEFASALRDGKTLDELNLQAGDRIDVATKPSSGLLFRVAGAVTALSGLIFLVLQVF